jgi:hypothetical protein
MQDIRVSHWILVMAMILLLTLNTAIRNLWNMVQDHIHSWRQRYINHEVPATSTSSHTETRHAAVCDYPSGQHVFQDCDVRCEQYWNPETLYTARHDHGLLSACKTVIGIVCDTHWVGGRDIYEVKKWSWSSFWPVSPKSLRPKRMREANTPCRTPWNLVNTISQLALDTMCSHLHVYNPTLPLPWDLHQRFIYCPGIVRETAYRQSKRNCVHNRNCLKDSQVKQKRSHKPNDIPKSDSAYSKLPFNKVDANLLIERMPLERSCIE